MSDRQGLAGTAFAAIARRRPGVGWSGRRRLSASVRATAAAATEEAAPPQERPLAPIPLLLNGLQHVAIIAPVGLVSPVLVLQAAGADHALRAAVISASLLALGLGSLLLCWRGRSLGSGFLTPANITAAYLPGSLLAAEAGGLPLVFGMTLFAGVCGLFFSAMLRRLRPLLPAEIAGLAVVMIGLILGLLSFRLLFGLEDGSTGIAAEVDGTALALGVATLALIAALNIWGKGPLRTFSVLIGLSLAYPLAAVLGLVDLEIMRYTLGGRLVTLPSLPLLLPAFDWSLVPIFVIAALSCSLRAAGDITTSQRIADPANWVRPDFGSIQRGLRADGLGTILAGALGTVGMNTSSSSMGLVQATGVVQRRVGFAIAGIFIALAFLPPVTGVAAALPAPLTGAVLLFAATFILANGFAIIVGRLLDTRRILAIGLALILGLSHDVYTEFYTTLPPWLRSLSGSSLVVAMVVALGLNALFRIGIKKHVRLEAPLDPSLHRRVVALCRERGPVWGARRDVMDRVTNALTEAVEMAHGRGRSDAPFALHLDYDEFRIRAVVSFAATSEAECAPEPAPDEEHDEMEAAALRGLAELELRLMRHFADRVSMTERRGRVTLRLQFET